MTGAPGVLIPVVAAVLLLSGCTTTTVVEGSEVTVAVSQPFTSLNPMTSSGRASVTNADVASLTGAAFAAYDDAYRLVDDPSFGSATIVAEDPLTVRYTVSRDARWSDGTAVDAADLLLAWVANSGALNTPDFDDSPYIDPETGRYTEEFPSDVVYFDGAAGSGIETATQTPQFGTDGRTLFVHFEEFVPGWKTVLAPGIPAHALQQVATGEMYDDAQEAKDAVVAAVRDRDTAALGALARAWNDAWNLDEAADAGLEPLLTLSAGPYVVSAVDAGGVVLEANPQYRGSRSPTFATIRVRHSPDPLETVGMLSSGEVDIVTPEATPEIAAALLQVPGVTVTVGTEARVEHVDLQFADSRNGVFDDERVREAFLRVLPRQQILDELVVPVQPEAGLLDSFLLRPGADGYDDAIAGNGSADFGTTDVDAAIALLADAGVTKPKVCLLFDPKSERRQREFELIAESAGRAGFVVTDCSSNDWQGLLGVTGSYDAALFAWNSTRLGPGAAGAIFRSDSQLANFNRYADEETDALVDELARASDPAEQARLAAEIDARLFDAAYGLPLYAYPTLTAVRDTVTNVTRSPLARGVFWNAWAWAPASE